jgi:hypothetical protein
MGIQDREYWGEWHKDREGRSKRSRRVRGGSRRVVALPPFLAGLVIIVAIVTGGGFMLKFLMAALRA